MLYVHIGFSCRCNIVVYTVHATFFKIVRTIILHWHGEIQMSLFTNQLSVTTYLKITNCEQFQTKCYIKVAAAMLKENRSGHNIDQYLVVI